MRPEIGIPIDPKGISLDPNDPRQKEFAEKQKEIIIDIQSRLYDKTAAYSNIIMLGGYAGGFTIWSYTKAELTHRANVLTALLLGFSLFVFILHEIYKIIIYIKHYNDIRSLISDTLPSTELFEKINEIKRGQDKTTLRFGTRIAAIVIAICTLTVFMALCVLFYNFCAILLGWQLWPLDLAAIKASAYIPAD
jgi:hypothetical protein